MSMPYIDLHCDTLLGAFHGRDICDCSDSMLDIRRITDANQIAQVFAMFFPPEKQTTPQGDREIFDKMYSLFLSALDRRGDAISLTLTGDDIEKNRVEGRCSALLSIENGRAVRGSMDKLEDFYDLGLRILTPLWNDENCFGYPNSTDSSTMNAPLKPFGRDAVAEMNRLGILVDVSHMSDGGIRDVCEISKKPVIASHSNCREICDHPRNLSDELIKAVAETGGVIGITYVPEFTSRYCNITTFENLLRHLEHLIDIGGEDCVALGSDFDGFSGETEIKEPADVVRFLEYLRTSSMPSEIIEKVAWRNALRTIKEAIY